MNPEPQTTVLATSDLHGFLDGMPVILANFKPDILVIAGDTHPCRIDVPADLWFRKEFFPLVEQAGSYGTEVVLVPGNHDFWLNDRLIRGGYCNAPLDLPPNLHILCDSGITLRGLRIYGTPWVPYINGKWCWEASEPTLKNQFSKIPSGLDILVSHSPPLIKHAFIDIANERPKHMWRHFGSPSLTDAIREKKPKTVVCGHIHSGDHNPTAIQDVNGIPVSTCYNVSRVNEAYSVYYAPQLLTFPVRDYNPPYNGPLSIAAKGKKLVIDRAENPPCPRGKRCKKR